MGINISLNFNFPLNLPILKYNVNIWLCFFPYRKYVLLQTAVYGKYWQGLKYVNKIFQMLLLIIYLDIVIKLYDFKIRLISTLAILSSVLDRKNTMRPGFAQIWCTIQFYICPKSGRCSRQTSRLLVRNFLATV